ncbi:SusC/RagA family TonB-linked outer membrane protein [Prolixibacteraceae bacterium JC049]|nr:SusC/RagA family TonB-linked outer membrane protein [Prolixibacteraceae bacterium JC049]
MKKSRSNGLWERYGLLKMIKMMRLAIIILFVSMSQVFAVSGYSQQAKLSLHFKNVKVEQVLDEIESQTNYKFLYNKETVDVDRKVNVSISDRSVNDILDNLFRDSGISFKIFDQQILLSSKVEKARSKMQQENVVVTGQVTDSKGESLPGVSVIVKGTTLGITTDIDGKYALKLTKTPVTLQFSFVGMKTEEVEVTNQTLVNVVLKEDAIGLEEVVAVGYGVVKKSDLTGAVSSVKADDLAKVGMPSVAQALAGKAAGLNVTQNSAQPGGGLSWQIRGSATGRSPLIIVDGFPITGKSEAGTSGRYSSGSKGTTLNTINPNDIESIEILKDASATAIYGARAAGGVVIITTKRGSLGKVTVDYRGSYSTQKLYNLPTMLNNREFMVERNRVTKELFMQKKGVAPFGDTAWDDVKDDYTPKYTQSEIDNFNGGTDWLDNIVRTGLIKQHNLTITSGTKSAKYLISLSAYNQDGIVKSNDFNRYTGRLNIDQDLSKWLKVGVSSSFAIIKENNVPLGNGKYEGSGVIRSALQFNPLLDIKDETGAYVLDPDQSFIPNPVSLLEIDDVSKNEDLFVNTFVEAKPIKGLRLRLSAGMNRNWAWRNNYLPTTTLYGQREGGLASRSYKGKNDYLVNFIAQYNKTIAEDHSFSVMAGYEYQKFVWEGFNAANNKFPYDGVKWYNLRLGEKEKPIVGSYGGSSEMASYISRFSYTYKNKYLLTANLRVDGSSNFAENNQWGVFPGVSVAWRLTEENFLKNASWLSNLKLRAGYGQTGNDNLSGVLTYYTPGWNYAFGSVSKSGIGLANIGNPDLKWETQTDLNIGIDFGFFNNKISGTIELYDRVVSDLLGTKPLLSYQAITGIKYNLDAEKQSRGIDFQLSTVNIDNDEFSWTSDFTFTFYRDRWRKRDASWKPDINGERQAVWGGLWVYKTDGLVGLNEEVAHMPGAKPGTIKIKDLNGYLVDENGDRILDDNGKPQYSGAPDGKIDKADMVRIGYNVPIPVGFNNTFKYKNFDLNIYMHAMFNRWAYNDNRTNYGAESFRIKDGTNMLDEIKDRWSYDNQTGTFPSIFQASNGYGHGDYFLEDAWFIRLKNVSLGYSLPKHILPRGFQKVRLFVDAQNLFVITPYSGMDPETGGGVSYPNQRTFTAGVEVKF